MDEVEISKSEQSFEHDEVPETQKSMDSTSKKQEIVSFFRLFAAADKVDYALMFLGSIGACLQGATIPVFFVLFGRMINSLGSLSSDPHRFSSEISKYALYLVYLGLVIWLSSWAGVACWTQMGERQTASLRKKCLQSVLGKNIKFFDTEAGEQNILFQISSDAILVQDAIGDKICHCICHLSTFFVGFLLGFCSVWQLTLLTLAIVPLIAIAGGVYTIIMLSLSKKGEDAYAEAGRVAQELVRKTGIVKGIGMGFTFGILFCCWALLLWYASVLVTNQVTNGGKAFTTILNVIYSGFALGQAASNLVAISKARATVTGILKMMKNYSSASKSSNEGIVLSRVDGHIELCQDRNMTNTF